jgi:hypothetical protein
MTWGDEPSKDESTETHLGWDGSGAQTGVPEVAKVPVVLLWSGIGTASIGVWLTLGFDGLWPSIAGWFIGGLVSVAMLGVFFWLHAKREATGWIESSSLATPLRMLLIVTWLLAVVLSSWAIADYLARREW